VSDQWRCGVCEGVNDGGRTCTTCGAVVPLRSIVATAVREELATKASPLPGDGIARGLLKLAFRRVLNERDRPR
jgi:hypothetical protein